MHILLPVRVSEGSEETVNGAAIYIILAQLHLFLLRTELGTMSLSASTKNENILSHWSVAKAGSNDEKNWGPKISLDCPL